MPNSLCSEEKGMLVTIRQIAAVSLCAFVLMTVGCASPQIETGFADAGKMQLQFYAPSGTNVTVGGCRPRTHQVGTYDAEGNRLERTPEEYAVFNLSPGTYEFKYTAADGLENLSLYGELIVHDPCRSYAKTYMRRSFIPVALPSAYYKKDTNKGDEIFPYRGQSVKTAIDETDLMRLKQGDVVEKVFVVADLQKANQRVKEYKQRLVVLDRELEYAEARFRDAYSNWRLVSDDAMARFFGEDREFICWEKKRLEVRDRIAETQAALKRAQALLSGDRVLIRKGMLAVATEEVVKPYKDVVHSADDLGEVMVVMRIGGRHMQWGPLPEESIARQ